MTSWRSANGKATEMAAAASTAAARATATHRAGGGMTGRKRRDQRHRRAGRRSMQFPLPVDQPLPLPEARLSQRPGRVELRVAPC